MNSEPDAAADRPAGANGNQPEAPAVTPMTQLDLHAQAILSNTLVGLVASLPQFVGGGPVLVAASRALGKLIGRMYSGDLKTVLLVRKECREAFIDGLTKQPVAPMPQPAASPAMTASPPHRQ